MLVIFFILNVNIIIQFGNITQHFSRFKQLFTNYYHTYSWVSIWIKEPSSSLGQNIKIWIIMFFVLFFHWVFVVLQTITKMCRDSYPVTKLVRKITFRSYLFELFQSSHMLFNSSNSYEICEFFWYFECEIY